jgi:hypothetical protein
VQDVWALPVYGGADDFPHLLQFMASPELSRETPTWPLARPIVQA